MCKCIYKKKAFNIKEICTKNIFTQKCIDYYEVHKMLYETPSNVIKYILIKVNTNFKKSLN